MKRVGLGVWMLVGLALLTAGCSKKTEQADLNSAPMGFDSATTEELAQLPQASSAASQQAAIEVLPIETSPVTQTLPVDAQTEKILAAASSAGSVERNKQIQTALKNAGSYNGSIDGKIGPVSKNAIENFQKNNGLKVDGKVGPKTWAALEAYLSGPAASTETQTQSVS